MKHALWVVASAWIVLGLPVVDLAGQTPAGAKTWASVADQLQNARDNEEMQRVPPFKVFDNLYYAGIGWVASWLITTDEGLIVIDALDERYADHLVDSIRKLGFNPNDVKYLIVSQAHFDHYGAAARLQDMYGVKVGMGEDDWASLEQLAAAGRVRGKPPRRDWVIRDGDKLTLGKTTLQFYSTPGHTPGTISFDFTVYDNGTPHRAFVFGGSAPAQGLEAAEQFVKSVNRIEQMQDGVEVSVVNHPWAQMDPQFWSRVDRLAQRRPGQPHPFVDPARFRAWIAETKAGAAKALLAAREGAPIR
jgi:metallo-beta-lactamase class B